MRDLFLLVSFLFTIQLLFCLSEDMQILLCFYQKLLRHRNGKITASAY